MNIQALAGRRNLELGLSGVGMDGESHVLFSYTLRGGRLTIEFSNENLILENVVGFVRSGFTGSIVRLNPTHLVLTFDEMRLDSRTGFHLENTLNRSVTKTTRLLGLNDGGTAGGFSDAILPEERDSSIAAAFDSTSQDLLSCSNCEDVLLATWEDGKPFVRALPAVPQQLLNDGWWLESATLFKSETEAFASVLLRHALPPGEDGLPLEKRLHVIADGRADGKDFESSSNWTASALVDGSGPTPFSLVHPVASFLRAKTLLSGFESVELPFNALKLDVDRRPAFSHVDPPRWESKWREVAQFVR